MDRHCGVYLISISCERRDDVGLSRDLISLYTGCWHADFCLRLFAEVSQSCLRECRCETTEADKGLVDKTRVF
jgi:hypothetical protein